MPRSIATAALACMALSQTSDALQLHSRPLPPAHPRLAVSAVMMAKKATAKLIPILLVDDVDGVGIKGDIVEMKPAYAENTIISKRLGIKATKEQVEQAEADKLAKEAAVAAALKSAEGAKQMIATRFGSSGVVIERMFTVHGEMSGGPVTAAEVSDVLKRAGADVELVKVVMDPIDTIGDSTVAAIELHPEVTTTVKVVLQKSKIKIA